MSQCAWACANSTSNPSGYALGIWLPVSHAPSCIGTTNPSRTGLNPLITLHSKYTHGVVVVMLSLRKRFTCVLIHILQGSFWYWGDIILRAMVWPVPRHTDRAHTMWIFYPNTTAMIQCGAVLTQSGMDVFCEFKLRLILCLSHCSDVCNIMLYWTAL